MTASGDTARKMPTSNRTQGGGAVFKDKEKPEHVRDSNIVAAKAVAGRHTNVTGTPRHGTK